MKKVVILGGGVAGLSAAHELVERGFDVEVYEMRAIPGGKARSIPVPHTGTEGRRDLPGEHGFRFFPRFYRHLPDTMKRIPYKSNRRGVYDNLVQAPVDAIMLFKGAPIIQPESLPRSPAEWELLFEASFEELQLFKPGEMAYFAGRLWQVLTSSQQRRLNEYERIGWWTFIGASDKERSDAYRKYLASTRILVAANPRKASVYTQANIALQLLLATYTPGIRDDELLNGPTNDVWIDPWVEYLRRRGVRYHTNRRLVALNCARGAIQSATVVPSGAGDDAAPDADSADEQPPSTGAEEVRGDYYILAVPLEVAARLLAQPHSAPLLDADPTLSGIVELGDAVEIMGGIQFYLSHDRPIVQGHEMFMDTPWALTAISQHQFWPNTDLRQYGDGTVRGILSVDISDWDTPGLLYNKPASECTPPEIADEVFEQMALSVNRPGQEVLKKEDIANWFLHPNIQKNTDPMPSRYQEAEPLLVAQVGQWHLRPYAYTRIPNLFIASDYVRTNTGLACMEGANEAARRAVNCIIDVSGVRAPLCKIWRLHEPEVFEIFRWYDERRFERGLYWDPRPPWIIRFLQHLLTTGRNVPRKAQTVVAGRRMRDRRRRARAGARRR